MPRRVAPRLIRTTRNNLIRQGYAWLSRMQSVSICALHWLVFEKASDKLLGWVDLWARNCVKRPCAARRTQRRDSRVLFKFGGLLISLHTAASSVGAVLHAAAVNSGITTEQRIIY